MPGAVKKLYTRGMDLARRKPLHTVSFIAGTVLLLLLLALAGESKKSKAIIQTEAQNTDFARMLILPGPGLGQTDFPLAQERKTVYTQEDLERNAPLYLDINPEILEKKRKAEIEKIFQLLD